MHARVCRVAEHYSQGSCLAKTDGKDDPYCVSGVYAHKDIERVSSPLSGITKRVPTCRRVCQSIPALSSTFTCCEYIYL